LSSFGATIYEPTVLWSICTFVIWTTPYIWVRVLWFAAGMLLTFVITWFRTPLIASTNPLFNIDRPIKQLADDKLDRKPLIMSLVKRLIFDNAPVVALVARMGMEKRRYSTCWNSNVRRLRYVLKRLAKRVSGLVPYAPSGLKDMFTEPSQQRAPRPLGPNPVAVGGVAKSLQVIVPPHAFDPSFLRP
jgi:hypothetical protein